VREALSIVPQIISEEIKCETRPLGSERVIHDVGRWVIDQLFPLWKRVYARAEDALDTLAALVFIVALSLHASIVLLVNVLIVLASVPILLLLLFLLRL
jgi:hypothetical protein